jgi:two-component system sensor histidine kinase QseC
MSASLRQRLLRYIFLPLALGMIAIGVSSYQSVRHQADRIFDAQLAHFAHVIGELTRQQMRESDTEKSRLRVATRRFFTLYEKDLAYRVWRDGQIVLETSHSGAFGPQTGAPGFSDRLVGLERMRFFTLEEEEWKVEVAESYEARTDLLRQVALSVLLPFFFILPLLGFAIWRGLRGGLKPLDRLSARVSHLDPDGLERVGEDFPLPTELKPFVASINHLIERVEDVIEREKRFTGYAAHELRTPLAALKTQLQVARREKDRAQRQGMYEEALEGIDRMTHLVNQLLLLLRSQRTEQAMEPLDLTALVNAGITGIAPALAAKGQVLEANLAPECPFQGNVALLRVAVRNLLDNAVRYSPDGARLTVMLQSEGPGHLHLCVHNTGVSLTPEECARMAEPFYRGRTATASGAGLGLAIVSWVAKLHHLEMRLVCEGDGLGVHLERQS